MASEMVTSVPAEVCEAGEVTSPHVTSWSLAVHMHQMEHNKQPPFGVCEDSVRPAQCLAQRECPAKITCHHTMALCPARICWAGFASWLATLR